MKAISWEGNQKNSLAEREIPKILDPRDALIRVTSTTICGSDLHLYHHEFAQMKKGDITGHEFMGIVQQVGAGVINVRPGDRVVCSFHLSCGQCYYCKNGIFSSCDTTNPNPTMDALYGHRTAGMFGYSHLTGGFAGGQAEWVRVPWADSVCLKVPDSLPDEKVLLLSDVACTGWHAVELGNVQPGNSVAIWGAGPIGLMAAAWAKFRGASRVVVVDADPFRLSVARDKLGCDVVNFGTDDPTKVIPQLIQNGPDVCIDAVGFRFPKSFSQKLQRALRLETDSPEVLNECIQVVRKGGTVSVVGDYYNTCNGLAIGAFMEKGLGMRAGQTPCQRYWKQLLGYIERGEFDPSFIFTHVLPFEEIVEAYSMFDKHDDNCVKVLLKTQYGLQLAGGSLANSMQNIAQVPAAQMQHNSYISQYGGYQSQSAFASHYPVPAPATSTVSQQSSSLSGSSSSAMKS